MSNSQYGPPRHQGWNQPPPQPPYYPPTNPQQQGWTSVPAPATGPILPPHQQPYVIPPRPFNHGVHVILDFCTVGLWIPVHVLIWALHPRHATLVGPDGKRRKV